MKFAWIFFLFVGLVTVNVTATSASLIRSTSRFYYISGRDTIIKLDSVRDKKLLKYSKSGSKTGKDGKTTAKNDTTPKNQKLESEAKATANDSTYIDNVNNIMYLYGQARVTYQDFQLDADFIRYDKKHNLIFASGRIDPFTKRVVGRPIFKQGKDKPVTADSLYFNSETKKGKIYNASTEQDGNYISGGQARRLAGDEVAYRNVIFSTCDKPYPYTDFGIVITKGIAEKNRIVAGPAYLEIEGVPLPLAIPFGFFPKPDSKASGILLPTFGEDAKLGFRLQDLGYYLVLSDYADLTTQGTIYSKGSYEIGTNLRYFDRYKYTGNLVLNYGDHNYGLPGDPGTKDFSIQWTHSENSNAHPGSTFSASVNAATSTYYQNQRAYENYSITSLTQNNLRSSISYGKTWAGTPFNFTADLSHSQDLTAKTVTLELPTFSFNMSTISPFDSKDRVGDQKWYQRITVGYSLRGTNKINAVPESELFTSQTLKRFQNGFQHQIPIGLNLNFLKYFQFNTSANWTELWYFQSINKRYARGSVGSADSLVVDTVQGFKRAGYYNLSAGVSTKLYTTVMFKHGRLKGIRHVMTPQIGFSYQPDFSDPSYGYYKTAISQATVPYPYSSLKYSIFEQSVYGGPPVGRQAGLSFSMDNTIEAKVGAKSTDTSQQDKKISILQGLSLSTFYNFAADSFRLTPISLSGHTAIFNNKLNLNFSGTLNPYVVKVYDSVSNGAIIHNMREYDRYTWQDGMFPSVSNINLSASFSLQAASIKPRSRDNPITPVGTSLSNMTAEQAQQLSFLNSDPSAYVDFNVPWNVSLNYSFNYTNLYRSTSSTNTLMISGDVNITPAWKVQYQTNYDFRAGKLSSATQFSIYRDLHCWNLSVQWTPFGYYKSYNVTLKVKSTILQDLKLTKRNDYTNNPYFSP